MTLQEAMIERHMVRRYTDKTIAPETIGLLQKRAAELNQKYSLDIRLKLNDSNAFSAVIKMLLAKGVRSYFIMAGPDTPDLDEKLGYCGAELMLYAQTLGLNTWWAGGTINRKALDADVGGNKVVGVISVGYGASQGKPHKSKSAAEVASYQGEVPEWFQNGVQAALLAPTALNRQAFKITGEKNTVGIACDNGIFSGADLGLVKYHFELGAGKENFRWSDK